MALRGAIPVQFDQVFPFGAVITTGVEQSMEFSNGASTGKQDKDKSTGLPVWTVTVMDADEEVTGAAKSVKIKVLSVEEPKLPPAAPTLPGIPKMYPVELEGMTVTPYITEVSQGRPKITYSIRATGLRAPKGISSGAPQSSGSKPNGGSAA